MLRSCVLDFRRNWDQHLIPIEFAYSDSYHSSIVMVPYEALYWRKCRSPVHWVEVERKIIESNDVPWADEAYEKEKLIKQRMKMAQSWQKTYADNQVKELEFEVGDQVFLKVSTYKGEIRHKKRWKIKSKTCGILWNITTSRESDILATLAD